MQGRLRNQELTVEVETRCACCGRELAIRSSWNGSSVTNQALSDGAEPLVFSPQVDWSTFTEPSIIHAY